MNLHHRKQIATILTAIGSIIFSASFAAFFDKSIGFVLIILFVFVVLLFYIFAIMIFNGVDDDL
jgi:hypothetical protein